MTRNSVVIEMTAKGGIDGDIASGAGTDLEGTGASSGALEGRPVVSATGQLLGTIRDVLFDEHTGYVVAYELDSWSPRPMCRKRAVVYLARPPLVGDVILIAVAPGPALPTTRGARIGMRVH